MGAGCSQLESQREGRRLHQRLIIVGHGPGVPGRGLGSWLDQQRVVRLKHADRPNDEDWGTRTDYVCASSPSFWTDKRRSQFPNCECWWLADVKKFPPKWGTNLGRRGSSDWLDYFKSFDPYFPKPSSGLIAVFCAVEFLAPAEIGLLGFDRVLHPDVPTSKWFHEQGKYAYGHDAHAEHRCLMSLGVKITEI